VMQDKQEREKKVAADAEKAKRDARRKKELNGINGAEDGEEDTEQQQTPGALPVRSAVKAKESRSMSPAIGRDGHRIGHAASMPNGAGAGAGKDSFLNYFFGKENGPSAGPLPQHSAITSASRHVSQNIEPSISASFRRGDTRTASLPEPVADEEHEENTGFVSYLPIPRTYLQSANSKFLQPHDDSNPALTEREALETELIRRLISSYFAIVRETTADQVPKAVMHLLVNHSKDVVQNRLVSELYKEELFEELLYEDDAIKSEREKCEKLLGTYKEAAKIIGEVL
jgi:dynamin 1-like protein